MTKQKNIDIEKILYPSAGKLKVDKEGTLSTTICTAELDELFCEFHNDECVMIHTDELGYAWLTKKNLYDLMDLIDRAENRYKKRYAKKDKDLFGY